MRKKWLVYSPEKIVKDGVERTLLREANEYWTLKRAALHFDYLQEVYGNAEMRVFEINVRNY